MAAEEIPEQRFDKYRLLGSMSAGGMAELYLALQAGPEGFSKVVALKRVLPHLAHSHEFIQMFMDEARLAARLDHPHIVRIYDFGEADGQYFMAMEYLPGEDLSSVLFRARKANQPVSPEIAAFIVQAAADGLHFAHELTDAEGRPLGLVHRDANPTNILVTYQGAVKVVDFGIAKAMGNLNQTQFGMVKGKAAYLAPEQAQGEVPLDRRADVFCLGIVLWEALTGQTLFARETDIASAQASVNYHPPPPGQLRPGVPPELDAIALKALAKDPGQRFQTAGEMQDALEAFFRGGRERPSSKEIAAWLEGLFGTARAEAKRAIAQGRNLQAAISQVMRPLVPTDRMPSLPRPVSQPGSAPRSATPSAPTSGSTPRPATASAPLPGSAPRPATPSAQPPRTAPRPATAAAPAGTASRSATTSAPPPRPPTAPLGRRVALALALLAIAAGLLAAGNRAARELGSKRTERAPAVPSTSELSLISTPPGAFIFLGGEPTGQRTPARLPQLPGESVAIRLELDGYEAVRDTVPLTPGRPTERSYTLSPRLGEVSLRGLPDGAELWVDGRPNAAAEPLHLPAGRHELVIKVAGQPDSTRTLDVKPGEQTVQLP